MKPLVRATVNLKVVGTLSRLCELCGIPRRTQRETDVNADVAEIFAENGETGVITPLTAPFV